LANFTRQNRGQVEKIAGGPAPKEFDQGKRGNVAERGKNPSERLKGSGAEGISGEKNSARELKGGWNLYQGGKETQRG